MADRRASSQNVTTHHIGKGRVIFNINHTSTWRITCFAAREPFSKRREWIEVDWHVQRTPMKSTIWRLRAILNSMDALRCTAVEFTLSTDICRPFSRSSPSRSKPRPKHERWTSVFRAEVMARKSVHSQLIVTLPSTRLKQHSTPKFVKCVLRKQGSVNILKDKPMLYLRIVFISATTRRRVFPNEEVVSSRRIRKTSLAFYEKTAEYQEP